MSIHPEAGAVDPFSKPPATKVLQVPFAIDDWELLSERAARVGMSRPALVRAVLRATKTIRPVPVDADEATTT